MKITIIIGKNGKIAGAFHGHARDIRSTPGLFAVPVAGPGQKFREVEVPDDIFPSDASPATLKKLPTRLKSYLGPEKGGDRKAKSRTSTEASRTNSKKKLKQR